MPRVPLGDYLIKRHYTPISHEKMHSQHEERYPFICHVLRTAYILSTEEPVRVQLRLAAAMAREMYTHLQNHHISVPKETA